jgi:fumarylacetoacetase
MNDPTYDPQNPHLLSWVESAQRPQGDFPIQNLPYGVFQRASGGGPASIGVAIGDYILDLGGCARAELLDALRAATVRACQSDSLNALLALGQETARHLRRRISQWLAAGTPEERKHRQAIEPLLVPQADVRMQVPAVIGDYTDFYASIHHATNVGSLFRPDQPLLPNYKYVPIGYHGRASSIVVSGTNVKRPWGQVKDPNADIPRFGPSRSLDYELEVGVFIGNGNALGSPVPIDDAEGHIFGLCLVNDWSARDIQAWEYQPLGPFLAKNFATSMSPWVVPLEALTPFRVPAFQRPAGDPEPLPYLNSARDRGQGGIDLTLEVYLSSEKMRTAGMAALRLSRGHFRDLYWTVAQMVAHHASNGCNLRAGDLLASGTVSGPTKEAHGCLLERTRRGAEPISLPTGEVRKFLEDGDEIILRGYGEREGFVRIGLGECRGRVAPALSAMQ